MIWSVPALGQLSILSMTGSLPNLLWASSISTNDFLVRFSSLRTWWNSIFSMKSSPPLCFKSPLALCWLCPSCPVSLYSIFAICFPHSKLSKPFVYLIIIFSMVLSCWLSYPQYLKLFLTILLLNKYQINEWSSVSINIGLYTYIVFSLSTESINCIRNNMDTQ